MKKIVSRLAVIALLLSAVPFLASCAKTPHDVYFKITGTATSVDIDIETYKSSSIFSSPIDSLDTSTTTLPWTSGTYSLVEGNVASITCYLYGSSTSSITVELYKDGSVNKTVVITGNYSSGSLQTTL